jgi:hypothetical protein
MTMIIQVVSRLVEIFVRLLLRSIRRLWYTRWGKIVLGTLLFLLAPPQLWQSGMWPLAIIICLTGLTSIVIGILQIKKSSSGGPVPRNLRHLWQRASASIVLNKDKVAAITNFRISLK